jgi:hypothetical protein
MNHPAHGLAGVIGKRGSGNPQAAGVWLHDLSACLAVHETAELR